MTKHQSTDEAVAAAYGMIKTDAQPQHPVEPERPQPKTLAEIIYPHLIQNQKGRS